MAPELINREEYCGKKVDIFAAGVVLFSIFCGFPPYLKKACNLDPYYKFFVEGR
jgi:serine/threonine protein kinase